MANHHYTQESAGGGRVAAGSDYVDEINIVNEQRQIAEDLAIIVGQEKLGDGNYPADGTAGTVATNVKKCNFEAVAEPGVTDDTTEGYAVGSSWIYNQVVYICVDATEDNAIWIQSSDFGEYITGLKTIEFSELYDNGNSGGTGQITINWKNGMHQKIETDTDIELSFDNPFVGIITLHINYGGSHNISFNNAYTILTRRGEELSFTKFNETFDILKIYYYVVENTFVVGILPDLDEYEEIS